MTEVAGNTSRRAVSRRLFTGGVAAALVPASLAPAAAAERTGSARTAAAVRAAGEERLLTLYAEKVGDNQLGYGLKPGEATIPGPLLEMYEGDTLRIELVNLTDEAVSLHVHGVDYEIDSDGTRMNKSIVEPGERGNYTWKSHVPGRREDGTWRPGSAGYWHYHDHVVGTDHGTGGIRRGLYGGLIVRREGDALPDKQVTIVYNDMTINNLPADQSFDFTATVGDRVEMLVITHGEYYHTFHVHGHRWADNRTGLLDGPDDRSRIVDTKITGPAESFGFQVIAGEGVGPGAWMHHCHVQSHADMGMAGLFLVADEDGNIPGHDPGHH
ncbi:MULTISPECIES: multicopper oxidase domain-containing protein [Streptomyces]|uniref:Multicopper oxidase domain-containing protein n=1 Tax=Streptomyces lycii TaxID=2654337 RepID=A0ABQ7F9F2_9ACTN|nr:MULTISPECIES: multicopper oxidase domain-containing protein [Streptomyces]KAF4405047.1 multicopper oxidase domain-containing protein [Streptomyces lycii]PGH47690.1 copper oxidase [Streptomyces sp. Ru87]